MNKQPNVIACICDQLRAFEVGCYGIEVVRTPNIDRLAAAGVRFEHAVSNDPVCMPARSSLISRQYARTCMGALGNASEFDEQGRPVALAAARRCVNVLKEKPLTVDLKTADKMVAAALTSLECVAAVYESHFTGARATLPLKERRHPLIRRL